MYPSTSEGLNKETEDAVYFFTPAFHVFDNFSAHRITLWGLEFPTAEHAFHWKKFSSILPDLAEGIRKAKSPEAAQKLAHAHKSKIPETWRGERVAVMEQILRAKAQQHEDVQDALRKAGSRAIIENSPIDSFWGTGPNGGGENMVGKIWMKIRDEIIK